MRPLETYQAVPILLHLHIPKTAGMALNDCILEIYRSPEWSENEEGRLVSGVYYPPVGIDQSFVPDDEVRRILCRPDVRAVVGHFSFGLHEWIHRRCEYVTLLRHPVDRIVSLYRHVATWEHEPLHSAVVTKGVSLKDFVTELCFTEVDNGQARRIAGVLSPFGKCDRDVLERAKRNIVNHFAVVGLTERLVESIALMKDRMNWLSAPMLRRKNASASGSNSDALPQTTLETILERNQLDLELYAFAVRRFEEQLEALSHGPL